MIGNTTGSLPRRALSSVWQTPTASTLTRISSSRGSSRSNSSIDSAAPASQATAAWIFMHAPFQNKLVVPAGLTVALCLSDQGAGGGVDPGAVLAYPWDRVAHPLDDLDGLEQPLAARLGEHVVPGGEAEDEVAPVVEVVL